MNKLKILSVFLVLLGVGVITLGALDQPSIFSYNTKDGFKPKNTMSPLKIIQTIGNKINPKPTQVTEDYTDVIVDEYDVENPYITEDETTIIHVRGHYEGDTVKTDVYYYLSFYHQYYEGYMVDCVEDPALDYQCLQFSNGVVYMKKSIGDLNPGQNFSFDIRVKLIPYYPEYLTAQSAYSHAFGDVNLGDYDVTYNLKNLGFKVYRVPGHLDATKIKVSVTPNMSRFDLSNDSTIVYTFKVSNNDSHDAKNVRLQLPDVAENAGCYMVVEWPNKNVSCSIIENEMYLGDIEAGHAKTFYVYTRPTELSVGDHVGLFTDSTARLRVDNAEDPTYVEDYVDISMDTGYVTVYDSANGGIVNYSTNGEISDTNQTVKVNKSVISSKVKRIIR